MLYLLFIFLYHYQTAIMKEIKMDFQNVDSFCIGIFVTDLGNHILFSLIHINRWTRDFATLPRFKRIFMYIFNKEVTSGGIVDILASYCW